MTRAAMTTLRTLLRTAQVAVRSYHPSPAAFLPPPTRPVASTSKTPEPVNPLTLRDNAIVPVLPYVQLVSATDNTLGLLQSTRAILAGIDPSTHTLSVVSVSPPIVKVLSRQEEKRKDLEQQAKAKIRRKTAAESKELQVSWSSAAGDLAHKLSAAQGVLERGDRLELVFAKRKGGGQEQPISAKRQKEIINMFETGLKDLGHKWREDDERPSGVRVAFWDSKGEVRNQLKQKVLDSEVERRKEKEEKKEKRRAKEEERMRKAKERQQ